MNRRQLLGSLGAFLLAPEGVQGAVKTKRPKIYRVTVNERFYLDGVVARNEALRSMADSDILVQRYVNMDGRVCSYVFEKTSNPGLFRYRQMTTGKWRIWRVS